MKVLLLIALVGAASAFVEVNEWAAFKAKHGKSYSNPLEELRRMKIYAGNKAFVDQHQKEFAAGLHTFEVELNKFADLSAEEFGRLYNRYDQAAKKQNPLHKVSGGVREAEVDWRQEGYVTGVKDQGQCGSCWAFSTTGSLEGAYVKAGHKLTSFSEQQLVDCSKREGNDGCQGGLMDFGFDYIKKEGGLETEEDYPYTHKNGHCHANKDKEIKLNVQYKDVRAKDESALEDAVQTVGPVSVAMDASHSSFQLYKSGIYNEPRCSSTRLDHGVLAVGYGTEGGKDYWIVKNSWGTNWGMKGYFQMTKGSNKCGIATQASYPTQV